MCFMCVASISAKRLRMWSMRVCMDRLYLRWPITHLFSIGEIGWTGNNSCNLLILLGVLTSVNGKCYFCFYGIYSARNYSMPAALVFTTCVVKGRKKEWHTNTAPTLSVSSYQPLFLDESTTEFDPARLPPPEKPMAWPAKDTVHHYYCDPFLGI